MVAGMLRTRAVRISGWRLFLHWGWQRGGFHLLIKLPANLPRSTFVANEYAVDTRIEIIKLIGTVRNIDNQSWGSIKTSQVNSMWNEKLPISVVVVGWLVRLMLTGTSKNCEWGELKGPNHNVKWHSMNFGNLDGKLCNVSWVTCLLNSFWDIGAVCMLCVWVIECVSSMRQPIDWEQSLYKSGNMWWLLNSNPWGNSIRMSSHLNERDFSILKKNETENNSQRAKRATLKEIKWLPVKKHAGNFGRFNWIETCTG